MICYADTSAVFKLVVAERETAALANWLRARDCELVTNWVGVTEVLRAAKRYSAQHVGRARQVIGTLTVMELSLDAAKVAGELDPPQLRSLDALHLASALSIDDLDLLVSYDQRMLVAAVGAGLGVASPGM